jgi:hypothetical protein
VRRGLRLVRREEGLDLEAVVAIRIAAPQPLPRARPEIQREEQHAPALVLPDVGVLVDPQAGERRAVVPEHDVPERDGGTGKRARAWAHPPAERTAAHFHDAVHDPRTPAKAHGHGGRHQPDRARRRRPRVPDRPNHRGSPRRRIASHPRMVAPDRAITCSDIGTRKANPPCANAIAVVGLRELAAKKV